MKKLFNCRRSLLAILGMISLTAIALSKGIDTSMAIATIITAVAASNAYQNKPQGSQEGKI
jgi:hypothetical protein